MIVISWNEQMQSVIVSSVFIFYVFESCEVRYAGLRGDEGERGEKREKRERHGEELLWALSPRD